MSLPEPTRRLAAIVSVDLAGYSSLTESDPARAARSVARMRERANTLARMHAGRVFNTAGDGIMLEFASASDALAVALGLVEDDPDSPARAGVHLGEVMPAGSGDLLGHGVNVAARIQAEAPPGGVLVSDVARGVMAPEIANTLSPRGRIRLAKMSETIAVFAAPSANVRKKPGKDVLLAVLPFDSVARDAATRRLAAGMSEELHFLVSRISGLKVIGSTSSFAFRGRQKSKAAKALSATHVLDGSVQVSDARVRVLAHLTEAESGVVLWSERYDIETADALDLQERIAKYTAHSMELAFRELSRASAPKISARLFDTYTRGRQELRAGAADDVADAVRTFEAVVREEPSFARAWAGLSTARLEALRLARFDRPRLVAGVREAAERTQGLDPDIGESYAALAALETEFGRWREREALLDRAVEAEPNNPLLVFRRGQFLVSTGQVKAGYAQQALAYELDPLDPMFAAFHGHNHWARVSKEEGHRILGDAANRHPDNIIVWYMRLSTAMLDGDFATVAALRASGAQLLPPEIMESAVYKAGLIIQDLMQKPTPEAFASLDERVTAMAEREPSAALDLAVSLSVLGRAQPALALFTNALGNVELWRQDAPAAARPHIGYETALLFLDATVMLRANPSFVSLCDKLGLVRYWRETDAWPDCATDHGFYDFKSACLAIHT